MLSVLAAGLGIAGAAFLSAFDSDAARAKTQAHFRQARQAGVRGFPALILQQDTQLHPITAVSRSTRYARQSTAACCLDDNTAYCLA